MFEVPKIRTLGSSRRTIRRARIAALSREQEYPRAGSVVQALMPLVVSLTQAARRAGPK